MMGLKMKQCPDCKAVMGMPGECVYCYMNLRQAPGFFKWLLREGIPFRTLQFFCLSIMNGIFMHHFHYSEWEIIVQAICLGIILPGMFRNE